MKDYIRLSGSNFLMTKKRTKSTYEKFIKDPKQKALLDKEYRELLISEMLLAAMAQDERSVRKLAKAAGISPTIIQELKTGKRQNIMVHTLEKVADVLGYRVSLEKKSRF